MEQLKLSLETVAQEVCKALRGKEMPMRKWFRIEKIDEIRTSFPAELRPDINTLMTEVFQIWQKLTSVKQLVEVIEANPKLTSLIFIDAGGQNVTGRQTWLFNFLVGPFLTHYFSAHGAIDFDLKTVDETIDKFINRLRTPITRFISLSPLFNLELAMEVLEIAPGLRLRKLSTDELERWLNSSDVISADPISGMDLLRLHCAVEITNEENPDRNQARSVLNNLIGLLRLFTNRNVYIAFTEEEVQNARHPLLNQQQRTWGQSLRLLDTCTTIDASAGNRLMNLWRYQQYCPNAEKIELAFKRWADTAERLSDEDKLIDYWVAVESLFAPDSNQEVKFRASLRIAAFLGETPDKRKEIYEDMRNSYDWRSAIVHGELRKQKKIKELIKKSTLRETTEKTRSYLRDSILRLLESSREFDPIGIELRLLGN